jgi:transposase-like protein
MKRHTAEQIIPKLRQAEADLGQGLSIAQVCQKLGVSENTFHRWRNCFASVGIGICLCLVKLLLDIG